MATYTPEQKESLLEKAMKLIFAEGYWICNEGHNARICVAKGGRCLVCDAEEKVNE